MGSGLGIKYVAVLAGFVLVAIRVGYLVPGIVDPRQNGHVVQQELLAIAALGSVGWFAVGLVRIVQGKRFDESHVLALIASLLLFWVWNGARSADGI